MADDTQKSIFDAFSGGTSAPAVTPPEPKEQTPPPSVSAGEGGSIFSAFDDKKQTLQTQQVAPVSFADEEPAQQKPKNIFSAISDNEMAKPETHAHLENNSDAPDPNAPWYKKIWETVNAPLFDENTAKNWFGWDVEHWNGWGKGLFDLASGLTSPLQIALTVGTFGYGALESAGLRVGASAGKLALEGIMNADEIAQVTKGSQILSKAIKLGNDPELAWGVMPKFGVDPAIVKTGLDKLASLGLNNDAMLAEGIVRRVGGAMLRGAGVDLATADKVGHFAQFAMDAGFTVQNAYGAAVAAPRVLDAIKEGDYESAKRLAIDALGSGAFAVLGGRAVHQHAGELMTDAEAAAGLRVKPSDENIKLIKLLEPIERERVVAGEREKQWEESARDEFKFKKDKKWIAGGSSESDLRARFYREAEGPEGMQVWHDAIADAAGRPRRIEEPAVPEKAISAGQKISGYTDEEWSKITDKSKAEWEEHAKDWPDDERLAPIAKKVAVKSEYKLPADIQEMVDNAKLEGKPKEYIDQLLKATDPRLLTDAEKTYSKHAGAHFDDTGTRAVGEEALQAMVENYVTRVFKNAQDADSVRKFRSTIASPEFSVDTAMARKRIFATTLEGILKGHELEDYDMIALAAHNGNEFSRIVSHRQALSRLRGAGAKGSDGRPMAALSGSGHVVESVGEDGETVNPGTIINPKAMQSIRMADKVVDGLKGRILKEGDEGKYAYRLRDIGEQGVSPEGHAQLTTRFEDMARWRESRSQNPQEMVRIPLDQLPEHERAAGPNGGEWITLKKPLEESQVEKLKDTHKPQREFTDLDRMIKEGRVVRYGVDKNGKELFAWTTHDYRTVDNPAFRGWKVPTTDTDGNPVYVQGELKVHPDAHEYLQRRFGTDQGLTNKVPDMKAALAVAREAKGSLLAFSPFHFVQEGLRAVMTGISPIGFERFNPENPMHVLAAEKGVWEFKDYKGVKAFEDGLVGHSKLISKVPGLREIQSWTQSMLFDRYIPGLKLRAFERMYEANKSLHPEWTKEKLANESADEVNERFGGIPYKRIGRAAATMDIARLTTLAPDWLESEMRFMKRVFVSGEEGAVARRDVLKMTLGLWAAARVLNYMTTGKAHNEAPFGVAWKDEDGREKVYSIRTMPGDMLHAIQDPVNFLNGRASPLLRTAVQTGTGRDEYGRKMSTNGVFVNLLRNVSPIGVQGVAKKVTGQDTQGVSNLDQGMKAAGFTVFPYRTEAQKLAAKIASDHTEAGPVDQDKLRRHQGVIEIEDRLRTGQMPITDVYKAVEQGQLHVEEAKKIIKNLQETQGMDHETARLYAHAARLPMSDLIKVWNEATNEEKAALSKLLLRKKTSYLKKAFKEMSPAERQTDATYQWIKKSFPGDPLGMGEITVGKPGTSPQEFTPSQSKPQVFKEERALPGMKVGGPEKIENAPIIKGVKVDTLEKAYDAFEGRTLTKDEIQKVAPIFQNLLDLGTIQVHDIPQKVLSQLEGKDVLGVVTFARPTELALAKLGKGDSFAQRATTQGGVVGHEITHIYQAHGGKYREDDQPLIGGKYGKYDYGTLEELSAARGKGLKFSDLTIEQQGEVVENYIDTVTNLDQLKKDKNSGRKTYLTDVYTYQLKAFQPYVDDLIHSKSYKAAELSNPKRQLDDAVDSAKDLVQDIRKGNFSKLGIF